ncbi:BTAD domain-containing putative transcriptional regulator [Ureibacillus aquaedulcis]|uniref:BTAD domain-containing putative transcriptional regulator n=1 Tax=Ureibacillus aquaedulcis TaxID=3058421 RepID=A0ABT8GQY2_9BACL|nr:BTAD domain-containing putative transcriptional regulator [Ureibacillus sp. BA0131]MDN4493822.1 BTAD domain-containing putative transcriptional regulator [Ureibacillus sp. BA0131]
MQNILMSKLIPPDPSIYYLRRRNLLKKLSKSETMKLTIVHSGAGFGKTSALAQLMADSEHLFSWYQVTEEDDDTLPFFRHLFYSIQRIYPQFGTSMGGWDNFTSFLNLEELNKLALLFINEFYKINKKLFIVIDDFHVVHHVFQINFILNKIIENLPPKIHLIVASRIYPNWNCLLPLRMNGKIIECKEEDFVFTTEEVQVLFEDFYDRKLTSEETEAVLSVTEGWAIAVCLLAFQSNELVLPIEEIANLSLHDFFAYISEEVFETLNEAEKDALLKCSIFQSFTLDEIGAIYDEEVASKIKSVVKRQSFIQPLIGFEEFRFHALFHQFLEMKLLERNKHKYTTLHKKAADYFRKTNKAIKALYHSGKSKDQQLITDSLVHFAGYFIEAGQFDHFLERIKELSIETKEERFILYFYEGECQRFRAQYEKAKRAYEKCLRLAQIQQDDLATLRANAGMAHIYLDTIQPALAENYLIEALELAEKVELEQEEVYLLERQYAENLVNLGRAGEAEERVKRKGLPDHILIKGNLDVRMLLRQGKLVEAGRLFQKREGREILALDAHRESDVLHALILTLIGNIEEAFDYATMAIQNSVKDYAEYAEAVAYLRKGHAMMLLSPKFLKAAENCYLKTNDLMDGIHVTRAKAESYMGLALVKSRQGYLQEAISYANQGLYETERVQDQWVSALLLTAFTVIYVEGDNFGKAKECAQKANTLYQKSPDYFGEMVTNFWLALISFRQGSNKEFNHYFLQFLTLCQKHQYYFFLQKQTLLGPRLSVILEIASEWVSQNNNEESHSLIQLLQVKRGSPKPKHSFELVLFGPFIMMRDGDEIADKEWKREKAKELFLVLYINRHRYVSKEEIMHTLWPNSDEQSMNRDFKVVYNACLKVIEPNRSPRDESAYIVRKQSMYRLHQSIAFSSDIDVFKVCAQRGLEEKNPKMGLEWLHLAASLYKGDLLEDFQTAEWLTQQREELRRLYILVMERIAQNYTRLKEFQKTIEWAQKLLQLEETWEEGYRLIMLAYYYQDNRPQAVKWYEKCVKILEDELAIEPMETTEQIFEMISR